MAPSSVTPSSFQINEGNSVTTSLSGFTPGSTLFFKVSGRGINKKDFAAGALKGKVTVDANGVATIAHTLRADKATEGAESFSIQVFSDKKMRNPLGQSESVSITDTSQQAGKASGGGGGSTTDPVTGLSWTIARDPSGPYASLESDRQYNLSEYNKILNSIGYPSQILDSATEEWELGTSYIVHTLRHSYPASEGTETRIERYVYGGDFKYKNGKLSSAVLKSGGAEVVGFTNGVLTGGRGAYGANKIVAIPDVRITEMWLMESRGMTTSEFSINYTRGEYSSGGPAEKAGLEAFGGGRFFYANWWDNPFDSNLI